MTRICIENNKIIISLNAYGMLQKVTALDEQKHIETLFINLRLMILIVKNICPLNLGFVEKFFP